MRTLTGHSGWVISVAFSPNGKRIVSGSEDNLVKIWEIATGAEVCGFVGVCRGCEEMGLFAGISHKRCLSRILRRGCAGRCAR